MVFINILSIVIIMIGAYMVGFSGFDGSTMTIIGGVLAGVGFVTLIVNNVIPRKAKKNRTTFQLWYKCDREKAEEVILNFLKEMKFVASKYGDETVYRKGDGWWTARKFITYAITDENVVTVEGWIAAGTGKRPGTETNLHQGIYGGIPRENLKAMIAELETRLKNISQYYIEQQGQ